MSTKLIDIIEYQLNEYKQQNKHRMLYANALLPGWLVLLLLLMPGHIN